MASIPWHLKDQAQAEAYEYFDQNVRGLPKQADGKVNPTAVGLQDNDVDAFRHAYVSGVFTQEYGEATADVFGRLNEFLTPDLYSNSRNPGALNMDLWNNEVGRKHGGTTKDRRELLRRIDMALKNGELIVDPSDKREFQGAKHNPENTSKTVVVLSQKKNGQNELFFDVKTKVMMGRLEFVARMRAGDYPAYTVKRIGRALVPVSNPDGKSSNNLG